MILPCVYFQLRAHIQAILDLAVVLRVQNISKQTESSSWNKKVSLSLDNIWARCHGPKYF